MILRRAGNGGVVTSASSFFLSPSARNNGSARFLPSVTRHYCRTICKTIFRDNLQLEFIVTIFKKIVKPREVIVWTTKKKKKKKRKKLYHHPFYFLLRVRTIIYLKKNISIIIQIKNKKFFDKSVHSKPKNMSRTRIEIRSIIFLNYRLSNYANWIYFHLLKFRQNYHRFIMFS